ncbi:glycosyltransferase [Roseovarius sp. SYSU LYC5161]|uniref:glycosyltransferase n=1 Tax=Roseovarius halophilus (ex Wu et al. 2025) TaxID=3376060 RepID=UPI003999F7C6
MTATDSAPRLLIIAPAPVVEQAGRITLDTKFIEGMKRHCALWPGPVTCLLRRGAESITFGAETSHHELPFDLDILDADERIGPERLRGNDIVLCSADDHSNLHLAGLARATGTQVVFAIEYILETRLQIAWLDRGRGPVRRLRSMLWNIAQERRRRRAIRAAAGLQSNGYPAYRLYGPLSGDSMVYLDNRMTPDLFCDADAMQARHDRLASGAPLRLVYSGRLEPMKGVQDLVPVAKGLADRDVDFTLDIFGTGSLSGVLGRQIDTMNLSDRVRLHDPVDFESALVPWTAANADIYLCCHKQSDPSCTYIESMGCGIAVAGYGNRMWRDLCDRSGAGRSVPLNDVAAMVRCLDTLDKDRQALSACCDRAITFARAHAFDDEFARRMQHLRQVAGAPPLPDVTVSS